MACHEKTFRFHFQISRSSSQLKFFTCLFRFSNFSSQFSFARSNFQVSLLSLQFSVFIFRILVFNSQLYVICVLSFHFSLIRMHSSLVAFPYSLAARVSIHLYKTNIFKYLCTLCFIPMVMHWNSRRKVNK